jgi:hypothetical protein
MRLLTFIESSFILLFFSGICMSDDMPFISMAGDCRYPAVTSEGNSIYMVWVVAEGQTAKLNFRRSMDEGATWSSARKLCNDNGDCFPPTIAVHSGIVHVAWIDFGETVGGQLYYSRSLDGGETWEKNDILVADANSSRYPKIVCCGKNVYLIWQDVENKVFFKASHDQGRIWDKEMLLGKVGKHSCYCYPPAISCNGNELAVVWADIRNDTKGFHVSAYGFPVYKTNDKVISSVVCRASIDNGRTWTKERILTSTRFSKEIKDEIDNPVLLSDDRSSYLFWLDRRNLLLGEIFYAKFDPQAKKDTISGKNLFPAEKRSPKRPSVTFDKDRNFHLTWASFFNGESVVYYGETDPSGYILKERKNLTSIAGRYHNPILVRTPSGLMHVLWFNEPKDKSEWSKIFLKTSKDDGLTWEDWEPQKKDM